MCLCKGFTLLFTDLAAYAICVLILVSADRSGLERMSTAEQYTYIGMRSRLILTGEVKIDIRLLVALESEERLERDILSVRDQLLSALRTKLCVLSNQSTAPITLHLFSPNDSLYVYVPRVNAPAVSPNLFALGFFLSHAIGKAVNKYFCARKPAPRIDQYERTAQFLPFSWTSRTEKTYCTSPASSGTYSMISPG